MVFECPEVIENIRDMKVIFDMNDKINPIPDAENLELDLFVKTATLHGIQRRERLYGIVPKDTDTLEERRYRILTRENNQIPYTVRMLRKKLSNLCGEDGYCVLLDHQRLTVKVELTKKSMFEDVKKLLEEMVPLNIVLETGLLYNQYSLLERFTYGELENFTYGQLREDVIA